MAAALGDLVSPVDVGAVTGEFAAYLARTFRQAVSNGIWGWFDDDLPIGEVAVKEHMALVDAIAARAPEHATAIMSEHLRRTASRVGKVQKRSRR